MKIKAQTLMFNENKDDQEVYRYGEEVDTRLEVFSDKVDELQNAVDMLKDEEDKRVKSKIEQEEQTRLQLRYEEEKKIEEMKEYETGETRE